LPGARRRARWPWIGGLGLAALLVAALLVATGRHDRKPVPRPSPLGLPTAPARPSVINPVNGVGLRHVPLGRSSGEPVLALAVVGRSTWVLQADGLHVARPGGGVRVRLPAALQDAQLITDEPGGLVWLVA